MADSLASGSLGQPHRFDKWALLREANTIGKAYRNRAMELIRICRIFSAARAPAQSFSQDAALTE